LRFWEHELTSSPRTCIQCILDELDRVSAGGSDVKA
jgi:hypothetical protein